VLIEEECKTKGCIIVQRNTTREVQRAPLPCFFASQRRARPCHITLFFSIAHTSYVGDSSFTYNT